MARIPHELPDEFPDQAKPVEKLTKTDHHFGRLAASYDEVNRNIHLIESEQEPTGEVLEKLKKHRLKLKDEIADFLKAHGDQA